MKKASGEAQATARSGNVSGLRRRNISAARSRNASYTERQTPTTDSDDTPALVTSIGRSRGDMTPVEEIHKDSSRFESDDVRAPLVSEEDTHAVATPSNALPTTEDTIATSDNSAIENNLDT